MNALVIKTGKIVNIVDKRGDHYIDSNFNPYTKDELEFFIKQNFNDKNIKSDDDDDDEEQEKFGIEFNGQMMSFAEFNQIQQMNGHLEKILWLSATVVEQHPDFSPPRVADFCFQIYRILKENLRNG